MTRAQQHSDVINPLIDFLAQFAAQARPPSPQSALEVILEELQVIVKALRTTYDEVWGQQKDLRAKQDQTLRENKSRLSKAGKMPALQELDMVRSSFLSSRS